MEEKVEEKAEEKVEEKAEELKWGRTTEFGPVDSVTPVLHALLMLIDIEKQRTLEQIEHVKKVLETMKKQI